MVRKTQTETCTEAIQTDRTERTDIILNVFKQQATQ